jgi:hypothetical protein
MNRNSRGCGKLAASVLAITAGVAALSSPVQAGVYDAGKVLATSGVNITDGAAGGGITPWAVIAGYETNQGINGNIHYTYANLPNYSLNSLGAAVGFYDRLELSYAYDLLPTGSTFNTVGLLANTLTGGGANDTGIDPFNTSIRMDIFGAKLRVLGESIYDSDNLLPQVALGGFYKINHNKELMDTLLANKRKDFEAYVAITKIFFPLDLLVNVTVRYTAANQTGLTGFGGPNKNSREFRPEVSFAYLLAKNVAIGAEYAAHGKNTHGRGVDVGGIDTTVLGNITNALNGIGVGGPVGQIVNNLNDTLTQKESDWFDVFFAYFPNKNLSFVAAYANLGNITLTPKQTGAYFSVQASF